MAGKNARSLKFTIDPARRARLHSYKYERTSSQVSDRPGAENFILLSRFKVPISAVLLRKYRIEL